MYQISMVEKTPIPVPFILLELGCTGTMQNQIAYYSDYIVDSFP